MKKQHDVLGIFLAAVTGAALLIALLLRTFLPRIILPRPDAQAFVVLSLTALVLEHCFAKEKSRNYWLIPVYGALIFGLFPFAACFTAPVESCLLALLGAGVFTLVTFLFDTMSDRLSSGPAAKIAPFICAFGLFLASQCLMGII